LLCHALGMPLRNLFRLRQDYGGLSVFESTGHEVRLHAMNLCPDLI